MKIDKNIPIPFKHSYNGKWVNIARKMKKGDSRLVKDYTEANSFYVSLHRLGKKSRMRKQLTGGIRIWCL